MSDARWGDVADDFERAVRHFRNAAALHEAGGFEDGGLAGYRAGMALMHALQSGHSSAEAGMGRLLAVLGEERPVGADWHRTIIDRLARPGSAGRERPPLLDEGLARDLQETRRFRNLAMHSYGDFDPGRVAPTIDAALRISHGLAAALARFVDALDPPGDGAPPAGD